MSLITNLVSKSAIKLSLQSRLGNDLLISSTVPLCPPNNLSQLYGCGNNLPPSHISQIPKKVLVNYTLQKIIPHQFEINYYLIHHEVSTNIPTIKINWNLSFASRFKPTFDNTLVLYSTSLKNFGASTIIKLLGYLS